MIKAIVFVSAGAWLSLTAFLAAAPGEKVGELTPDGAWCWFADPRAVYHEGRKKCTYVGWVNRAGDVRVAAIDAAGQTVAATLHEKFQRDDHANPAILVRPDGRLMVFYSAHGGRDMCCRVSEWPEDVSAWGPERTIGVNTEGRSGYTYPSPFILSREPGRIYLFWRGADWKPNFATSEDGETWSPARTLIAGRASGGNRPYTKYCSNGVDTIHCIFTDGHPRNEPANSVYYAALRGGALWRADGTKIKDVTAGPLVFDEADKVYDGAAGGARAWIWDLALDASGRPVVAFSTIPDPADHRYHYARWDGKAWVGREITPAGKYIDGPQEPQYSGGMSLDPNAPATVYLSREIAGVHEIQKWTTSDGGATWTSRPVTEGSAKGNFRPYVPRGPRGNVETFWMHGDYPSYTTYETAMRYLPAAGAAR